MDRLAAKARCAAGLLFTIAFCCPTAAIIATAEKPSLSAEIERVLARDGIEAAKARFAEVYPAQKDAWEIDLDALMQIGMGRMEKGDMEAGMAVLEMATQVQFDAVAAAMDRDSPERARIDQATRVTETQTAGSAAEASPVPPSPGPVRDDLERFAGLYGDPADGGRRNLFVTVSCDGYLVAGPTWADVSPWWMRSESERVFTYADSFTKLRLEFAISDAGRVSSVAHDLTALTSPLPRIGPLPDDWPACAERPKR